MDRVNTHCPRTYREVRRVRQVTLPGTDMSVSRFSFGTASLFNVGSAKRRADLLAAAYDQGFTHFDTAPYYGFGTAESDLRPLLTAHPDITIATKVGIYSPGGEAQPTAAVFLRKAAGRIIPALSRPTIDWSIARARNALTASLRRLGRERVDLYLLHEPEPELLDSDEWLHWLESEYDRVARFGIAVDSKRLGRFIAAGNPLASVIQTVDSIMDREADILEHHRPLQITYGYVSAAQRHGPVDVPAILASALRRNKSGSVIVSTRKLKRLRQYVEISDAVDKAPTSTPIGAAQ
jgi:D-threo-aldose 1-dehydrogenase